MNAHRQYLRLLADLNAPQPRVLADWAAFVSPRMAAYADDWPVPASVDQCRQILAHMAPVMQLAAALVAMDLAEPLWRARETDADANAVGDSVPQTMVTRRRAVEYAWKFLHAALDGEWGAVDHAAAQNLDLPDVVRLVLGWQSRLVRIGEITGAIGDLMDAVGIDFFRRAEFLARWWAEVRCRLPFADVWIGGSPHGGIVVPVGHFATTAVRWLADSQHVITGDAAGTMRIWRVNLDERSVRNVAQFRAMRTAIDVLAMTRDASAAVFAGGGTVQPMSFSGMLRARYDQTVIPREPLPGTFGDVTALELSPCGRFAVIGGKDGTVELWRLADFATADAQPLARLCGVRGRVGVLAVSSDFRFLLTAMPGHTARMWHIDTAHGKLRAVANFIGHTNAVCQVGIVAERNRVMTGGADGRLILWDFDFAERAGNSCQHIRRIAPAKVLAMGAPVTHFSHDASGRTVIVAGKNGVTRLSHVSNSNDCFVPVPLPDHLRQLRGDGLELSGDGRALLVRRTARLLEIWPLADRCAPANRPL